MCSHYYTKARHETECRDNCGMQMGSSHTCSCGRRNVVQDADRAASKAGSKGKKKPQKQTEPIMENGKLLEEIAALRQELRREREISRQQLEEVQYANNECIRSLQEDHDRCIQSLQNELDRYKSCVLNMAEDIKVADIRKQATVITPGEPTRSDAATSYGKKTKHALFSVPKRVKGFSDDEIRQFSNNIFQVAYDTCKGRLLKEFKMKLKTLVTVPADRECESCLTDDEEECFTDLRRAYGLLLSACKMKQSSVLVDQVKSDMKLQCRKNKIEVYKQHSSSFDQVIDDAVNVAWEMLTLLPPAILCMPKKFFDEWHTINGFSGDKTGYFTLKYYRPLMLSHAHGPPAVKAMIVKVASSVPTLNETSDSEDSDEEKDTK